MKTRKIKAQAAMEYLMTYGWAILIVVIVAAALYALGIFTPPTGTICTGFVNLGCPQEWQVNDAGDFNLVIKNAVGQQITISAVNVTVGTTLAGSTGSWIVSAGSSQAFSPVGLGAEFSTLNPGDSYSAGVEITYIVAGGTLDRKDTGTLTGSVV